MGNNMDEDSPKYGSNPYPVQVRVNIFNTFTLRHITISLFSVSNLNYPLTLRTNQMQQGSSLPTQAMFHGKSPFPAKRLKYLLRVGASEFGIRFAVFSFSV